jgi:cell division protein FtsW
MSHADRSSQALKLDDLGGRFDPWLVGITLALAAIGIVMVASSSMPYATSNGDGPFHYLGRHLIFLGIGVMLAAFLMHTELRQLEKYGQGLMLACFLLLLAVWLPGIGHTVNGARRWVTMGISNFQVVEAVKLLFIVWLSSYLVRHRNDIGHSWLTLLKPIGIAMLIVGLLLAQPDFGSAALILSITLGMVWLGGASVRYLLLPGVSVAILMAIVAIAEPYRVKRLTSFLDPWADQFNSGFQLVQAFIAIGRGEWTGVGLGGSILKLDYLPEAHTDFIFSVLAEEFGFIGVCVVVILFAALAWRTFALGLRCVEMRRPFAGYCAFGIGLWISLQSAVSMGVNLGVLPTKGLTLPLISSGGSSVLMTCAAMGLLLRVSYELDRAVRVSARLGHAANSAVVDEREDDVGHAGPSSPSAILSRLPRGRVEPKFGAAA